MKLIPLPTKYNYYCSEDGRVFKEKTELKGWKHESFSPGKKKSGKYYLRFGLWMKNGKRKFFFAQRIVGMCYHSLLDNPKQIMRHLTSDTFNNHFTAVIPGTHEDNQTIDRIEQGTYMNRGGGGSDDDINPNNEPLPF